MALESNIENNPEPSFEELFAKGVIEFYSRDKHYTIRNANKISLKESTIRSRPKYMYLDSHYDREYIKGVYLSTEPIRNNTTGLMEITTARGDVVVEQPYKYSCHAVSAYMVAVSKKFPVPKEFIYLCHRAGKIYDYEQYYEYASMFGKQIVIKHFENLEINQQNLMSELKKFVREYGVSCISSGGHVKVLDGFISSKFESKEYLVIRDPLGFHQLIYDINTETPTSLGVEKINYVLSFV